jgi:hypothetical protein
MDDQQGRDSVTCPVCGLLLKRVYTIPNMVVMESISDQVENLHPNQSRIDVDGRPCKLNFVDHGDRSEVEGGIVSKFAGARMDEKTGKPVVDVVSNVPDPLGEARKNKKTEVKKIDVNQPYKTPKVK